MLAIGMIGIAAFMLVSGKVLLADGNSGKAGFQVFASISLLLPSPSPVGGGDNPTEGDEGAVVASGLSDCV